MLNKIMKDKKKLNLDFPNLEKTARHFFILKKLNFLITFILVLWFNVVVFRMMQRKFLSHFIHWLYTE